MTRTLNGKLALLLLGLLLASAAGMYALHEYQVQRFADRWLLQARRAGDRGDADTCLNYLSRYLIYRPDDVATLAEYGLWLDKTARTPREQRQTIAVLETVLARRPDRADVRERLVHLAIQRGRFTDAQYHLGILLSTAPTRADYRQLLAGCLAATGDAEQAVQHFEAAIQHDPAGISAALQLAELYQSRLEDPLQARAVLDRMATANPQSTAAYLGRARFALETGDLEQAAADLQHARELAPTDPAVLLVAAALAPAQQRLPAMRTELENGLQAHPRHAGLYRALAQLELETQRPDQALACLRRGLQTLPDDLDLLQFLCELLLQRGELSEAASIVQRLRQANTLPGRSGYWDARLLMARGEWLPAVRLLDQAREHLAAAPAWSTQVQLALAACYGELGDPDRAILACQRAVAGTPSAPAARLRLGAALLAGGQVRAAVTTYRQLVKLPGAAGESRIGLAEALLRANLQLTPADRDWPEVMQVLDQAAKAGDSVRLSLLRAEVLTAQQLHEEARAYLATVAARDPTQPAIWIARAALEEQLGNGDAALLLLDQGRKHVGEQPALTVARLQTLARQGKNMEPLLPAFQQSLAALPVRARAQGRLQLAATCWQTGQVKVALVLAEQAAAEQPDDLVSRLFMLDLLLAGTDDAALQAVVQAIRRIEGDDGASWRTGEAARLIKRAWQGDRQGLGQARELLAEAAYRRPTWHRVPRLQAALAELEGQPDRAIEHGLHAMDLGDRQLETAGRLVQLLCNRRRYAEADAVIRMLEEQAPVTGAFARLAAEIALASGNRPRALVLARRAVLGQDHDFRSQLWLSNVLEQAGQPSEALALLREAVETSPRIPDPWIALVQHLAKTGQRDEAAKVIQKMRAGLPADPIPLALARCHEALGQRDLADKAYQEALTARPDDYTTVQQAADYYLRTDRGKLALPYLRQLLAPTLSVPAEPTAWARRELALALVKEATAPQVAEALTLLQHNQAEFGPTVADQRALARVLATRPDRRDEALRVLEQTLGTEPLTPGEERVLAHLYDAAGEPAKARKHLLHLLAIEGQNPEYLADFVQHLLRTGEGSEARSWLARLEQAAPHAARTRELKEQVNQLPPPQSEEG